MTAALLHTSLPAFSASRELGIDASLNAQRQRTVSTAWAAVFDLRADRHGAQSDRPGTAAEAHPCDESEARPAREARRSGTSEELTSWRMPHEDGGALLMSEEGGQFRYPFQGGGDLVPDMPVPPNFVCPAGRLPRQIPVPLAPTQRIFMAAQATGPQGRRLPAETVVAYEDGTSIAVAVRNRQLPDDEAIRCAQALARAITGAPRNLSKLTLNGRVVYEEAAGQSALLPPAGAIFSC